MQKTKLGISVGLLGAAIYFLGLFSGYLAVVLLTGYVLLFEENGWLKKNAVKAVALLAFFSLLTVGLNLIPNIIGLIDDVANIFEASFGIIVVTRIITVFKSALNLFQTLLFLGLGFKALNQGTIAVPVVDNLIGKYMD